MYKIIFLILLLTGCDIEHKNTENFKCDTSNAQSRAEFIANCVTELKANLMSCEEMSERLFCEPQESKFKDKNDTK